MPDHTDSRNGEARPVGEAREPVEPAGQRVAGKPIRRVATKGRVKAAIAGAIACAIKGAIEKTRKTDS